MTRPLTKSEQARVESMLPTVERLSYWCAKRNPSLSRRDFESVGRKAVVLATLRHDGDSGTLEAYALSCARGEMLSYARKTRKVSQRERMMSMWMPMGHGHDDRSAGERFDAALRSTPESDRREIVDDLAYRASSALAELAACSILDDQEAELLDWRATALGHQVIEKSENDLGEPDRTVFKRIYRDEHTLDEIASELAVSKRSVQRILDRVRAAITKAVRAAHIC